jgi:hypothetical protein
MKQTSQQRAAFRWFGVFAAALCFFAGYSYVKAMTGIQNGEPRIQRSVDLTGKELGPKEKRRPE